MTSRVRRMRHEPTYAGLYARHSASSNFKNRVILRTDGEFETAASVRDLLQNFPPARCSPYVFWHGFLVGQARRDSYARDLLDISVADVEGIEYYRDFASMPLSYRGDLGTAPGGAIAPSRIRRCGMIAIWPRRS